MEGNRYSAVDRHKQLRHQIFVLGDAKVGMEVSNTFVYVLGSVPLTLIVAVIFAAMMNSKIRAVGFFRSHLPKT